MDVRSPISPGRFYPLDPQLLLEQVGACYGHPDGPGPFPGSVSSQDRPVALIVPHGALGHSGPIAAHAYARLANSLLHTAGSPLELIVILGPDHLGHGAAVSGTTMAYATPCGVIPTDDAMVRRLYARAAEAGGPACLVDAPAGHLHEHSVENQLSFIQHLMQELGWRADGADGTGGKLSGALRLVPLTMRAQDLATALQLGELLDRELPTAGVLLVATSDMSHCGPLYGNPPPSMGAGAMSVSAWCRSQAAQAVAAIETMDPEKVVKSMQSAGLSMCGVGCVAAALAFARRRGATRAGLLAVSDSVSVASGWRGYLPTDPCGIPFSQWSVLEIVDPDNPVGFASLVLE